MWWAIRPVLFPNDNFLSIEKAFSVLRNDWLQLLIRASNRASDGWMSSNIPPHIFSNPFPLSFTRALCAEELRLRHGRAMDLLRQRRPRFDFGLLQGNRFSRFHRFIEGTDNANVRQPFSAGRFRFPIVQNAVKKNAIVRARTGRIWERHFHEFCRLQ